MRYRPKPIQRCSGDYRQAPVAIRRCSLWDRSARRREQATRAMPTRNTAGQWRVEWFEDDGRCELEIFTGHDARRQALRYAMRKCGHFREVQLDRTGNDFPGLKV